MSSGTLVLVGLALGFGWALRGRRQQRQMLYQPQRPVRAGKVIAVSVLITGCLVGVSMAQGASGGGPNLAGLLPPMPSLAEPAPSTRAGRAVSYARAQVGKPYRWARQGPGAFDCSGLTMAAWRAAGVSIPRTAAGQLARLPRVRTPKPGDLLIYRTQGPSRRHVAIVVGPGRMVEARSRRSGVVASPIRRGWLGVVRPGGR